MLEQHTAAGPQGALRKSRAGASRHRVRHHEGPGRHQGVVIAWLNFHQDLRWRIDWPCDVHIWECHHHLLVIADSMLLRAERGAKELPCRDSTASTVSTHPATIDTVEKSLHDSAAQPGCDLCGRWRQRTPRSPTPTRHPQNQANGLSRSLSSSDGRWQKARPGTVP